MTVVSEIFSSGHYKVIERRIAKLINEQDRWLSNEVITNSNNIITKNNPNRATWMIELCNNLLAFYPKEISKINSRIEHFTKVRQYWVSKN